MGFEPPVLWVQIRLTAGKMPVKLHLQSATGNSQLRTEHGFVEMRLHRCEIATVDFWSNSIRIVPTSQH